MLALHDPDPARARQALEQLCRSYWYPLYVYVRLHGYPPDQAEDVVQGFFEQVLERETFKKADPERGRFRTFLLCCLRRYVAGQQERAGCRKRGGGQPILSLDVSQAEGRYRLESTLVEHPDQAFERHWALAVIERVFERLEAESAAGGKSQLVAQLKDFIAGDRRDTTYAQLASRLGLTEGGLRAAVRRLRVRYRELFREEVAQLVESPAEVDVEIQHLFRVLAG